MLKHYTVTYQQKVMLWAKDEDDAIRLTKIIKRPSAEIVRVEQDHDLGERKE